MPDFGRYDADRQEYAEERRLLAIRAKRAGRTPREQEAHEAVSDTDRRAKLAMSWLEDRRAKRLQERTNFDRATKRPTNRGNR